MWSYIKVFLGAIKRIVVSFVSGSGLTSAGSLAYSTLLTLVPFVTLVFVISTQFPMMSDLNVKFEHFLFKHFVASSSKVIYNYTHMFAMKATNLSWIGVITLLITVFLLLLSIESSFNRLWHTNAKPASYVNKFFRHLAFLILIPTLVGGSLLATSYLVSLSLVRDAVEHVDTLQIFLRFVPHALIFLMIFSLYKFIPTARVSTVPALIGALITTIILKGSKVLFNLYITFFPSYDIIYGAFAAIPLFLLWLYIVWVVVLFGFQVISHLHFIKDSDVP
jgi:membrane protein